MKKGHAVEVGGTACLEEDALSSWIFENKSQSLFSEKKWGRDEKEPVPQSRSWVYEVVFIVSIP